MVLYLNEAIMFYPFLTPPLKHLFSPPFLFKTNFKKIDQMDQAKEAVAGPPLNL